MIKGLTDRRAAMFPRLAKIRLGVKRPGQSGAEFPVDTDYFVLTDCPEVAKVYGERPKKLIAMFASNEVEDNFPTRLEAWKASKTEKMPDGKTPKSVLFCNSDGETATRLYVGEKDAQGHAYVQGLAVDERPAVGEPFNMPCPYEACPYYENRGCREVGRLNVILPQVSWSGVYQIETSSMWAFGNIKDVVEWMRLIYNGQIKLKPFEVIREPVVMNPPELSGKSIVKHVIKLRIIDHHNLPAIPPPPFVTDAIRLKALADRPEDLFPDNTTAALPAVPGLDATGPKPAPEEEELDSMRLLTSIGKAEFELIKARLGGDVAKIRQFLNSEIDKQNARGEVKKPAQGTKARKAKQAEEPQTDAPAEGETQFEM